LKERTARRRPTSAATAPPARTASGKSTETTAAGITFTVRTDAVYAPSAMKPACPTENSPIAPFTTFKEHARIALMPTVMRTRSQYAERSPKVCAAPQRKRPRRRNVGIVAVWSRKRFIEPQTFSSGGVPRRP
jgi:hypothetical protein